MSPSRIVSSLKVLLCASLLSIPAAALPQRGTFDWDKTKHVVAFGDSYTYIQGTAGLQNFSFIGDYLPGNFAYTPDTLLSNKIVQNFTGTAEGGPNWIEYLTDRGVKPGLTSPLTCKRQLWDFAFAGADVAEEFTPLHHPYTIPLVNQTQQFLAYGDDVLKRRACLNPARTLVAIWIGINDINDSAKSTTIPSFAAFYASILDRVFSSSVSSLLSAGYRNFLFVNLPPLDKTPSNLLKQPEARTPNATMVGWWNDALAERVGALDKTGEGVTAMGYDANEFLNGVLETPERYGVRNTTGYCAGYLQADVLTDPGKYGCPVPVGEYFWFNSGHMTSHVHEVMAPDVERFLRERSG
ncbi:lysophospholipase A [Coniochaeta sp. 2T2.1]|nr:lysophospholipase A [Coniochaeta sp. 2T2.1]